MSSALPSNPDYSNVLLVVQSELLGKTGKRQRKDKTLWPPDYARVLKRRKVILAQFELNPKLVEEAKSYYRDPQHCVQFVNHWCDTWDPRNTFLGKPVRMPFVLFQRQVELVEFLLYCLKHELPGLVEKSRDMGATWVCVAVTVWLWLFWPGSVIGWGSRKQDLVDQLGSPSSIFEKIRLLITHLPKCFLPAGFSEYDHLNYMRCVNPESGAAIIGEIGDNIGRGARTLLYMKDESAHYERPEKVEAALSDTTRVPIDISSVNGLGNVFHRKREAGHEWDPSNPQRGTQVFVMDWRDHPDKDQAWYDERRKSAEDAGLLHVLAQELDRNYAASVEGTVIQAEWIAAAIDAHKKLKLEDTGPCVAGLDVADSGGDRNALAVRKGIVLFKLQEWGERDTGLTARRAVEACSNLGNIEVQYDSIGVGAGVKAESNRLRDDGLLPDDMEFTDWNAGAKVLNPGGRVVDGDRSSPRNKDFYANLKSQAWWELRNRLYRTYQAVVEGQQIDPDELISFDSTMPLLRRLEKELCQPTMSRNSRMKLLIDKAPEGTRSPNLADAVVMCYWPLPRPTFLLGLGAKVYVDGEPYHPA